MMMMIRKLLLLIFHQILCYGSWALRPSFPSSSPIFSSSIPSSESLPLTSSSSPPSSSPPQSATSSSTIKQSSSPFLSPRPPSPPIPGNRITAIQTNCTRDLFEIKIDLNKKFRGILFARDFLDECRTRGNSQTQITLKIPTSGCGVRSELKSNGSLELSVKVMLQMDEKLRQSSDIIKTIKCILPPNMMSMDLMKNGEINKSFRNGRMRPESGTISPPRVRIWLELGGLGGTGAVEVGQSTTLSVRAVVPGTIGVRVIDCAALDGLGESSQQLLDNRGCPIDEQVMPALHTRYRPAEEGWSKPHEDDLVERLFTATFPAFKFPDRERLHVSCGVQLCKGKCPDINCLRGDQFLLPSELQLARIEVFNSLAVTAPQIEIDRLRMDRRYNMSAEEYPPKIRSLHSEGTLCLSVSKLAMAFCILGFIFLIAIIVAICCLIRSRSRENNGSLRAPSTSVFSSSSGSQSRFGSKLLIPYNGGAALPAYGRVY